MRQEVTPAGPTPIRFERSYEAALEEVWELWTTKEGFESWWGPVGFRVEVHALEARVGGALRYDMIACGEEQIAQMKASGQPLSHGTHGTFVELEPHSRLRIRHIIDFIEGVKPYPNDIAVELVAEGGRVRMTITVDAHPDGHWTKMATLGMESQLTKLPDALNARRRQ